MSDVLILDGGLGTTLEQQHGITFEESTPLWSSDLLISDPDALLACQRQFGDVPVDILLTATYQVSQEGFERTRNAGFPDGVPGPRALKFVEDAVAIAEAAKRPEARIALSIGPYGACMLPSQEYSGIYDAAHDSEAALQAWHCERLKLFAGVSRLALRVSFIALETIPRLDEITALRKSLASDATLSALPFWISCLYPGEDETLPDGHSAESAVRAMLDTKVPGKLPWGIGINCTKIWKLEGLLDIYEAAVSKMIDAGDLREWPALVVYPDGTNGEIYNSATRHWEHPGDTNGATEKPWEQQLADVVRVTSERGHWRQVVVGGCCMASAAHIRRLRQALAKEGRCP